MLCNFIICNSRDLIHQVLINKLTQNEAGVAVSCRINTFSRPHLQAFNLKEYLTHKSKIFHHLVSMLLTTVTGSPSWTSNQYDSWLNHWDQTAFLKISVTVDCRTIGTNVLYYQLSSQCFWELFWELAQMSH